MIKQLHDNITQKNVTNYQLVDGKRIKGIGFKREVLLTLPLCLNETTWKRHGYNYDDIESVLKKCPRQLVWLYALLHGITASNSAIQLSFATPEFIVYGSKSIAIRKILLKFKNYKKFKSVLCKEKKEHVPLIPLHIINNENFEYLDYLINPNNKISPFKRMEFSDFFQWKDIQMIPVRREKNLIYCIRIIKKSIFLKSNRLYTNLCHKPIDVFINGTDYYGMIDEACFFKK
jgi:hypothetical protein